MGSERRDNLARYERRKATEELRGDLWQPALALGLGAVALVVRGAQDFGTLPSFGALAGAAVLAVLSFGFLRPKPWARVPGGVVLLVIGGWGGYMLVTDGPTLGRVFTVLVYLSLGGYLLTSGGREAFERTQPSEARSDEV